MSDIETFLKNIGENPLTTFTNDENIYNVQNTPFIETFGNDFLSDGQIEQITKELKHWAESKGYTLIQKTKSDGYYFNLYKKIGHISLHRKTFVGRENWPDELSFTGLFHAKNDTYSQEKNKKDVTETLPHLRLRTHIVMDKEGNAIINFGFGTKDGKLYDSNLKKNGTKPFTKFEFAKTGFQIINKILRQNPIKLEDEQIVKIKEADKHKPKEISQEIRDMCSEYLIDYLQSTILRYEDKLDHDNSKLPSFKNQLTTLKDQLTTLKETSKQNEAQARTIKGKISTLERKINIINNDISMIKKIKALYEKARVDFFAFFKEHNEDEIKAFIDKEKAIIEQTIQKINEEKEGKEEEKKGGARKTRHRRKKTKQFTRKH